MATETDTHQKQQRAPDWPLGGQLRDRRKAVKMSMREAAREAGFSVTTWQQLEHGYKTVSGITVPVNPRASLIVAASRVVGLDPAEALRTAGHDPAGHFNPEESVPATVSQRAMLDTFARLTQKQRRAVYLLLNSMLDDDDGSDGDDGDDGDEPVGEASVRHMS